MKIINVFSRLDLFLCACVLECVPKEGLKWRQEKCKKTNKQVPKASVIKPSLVLVMHSSAAKQQTWPSTLTEHGQSLDLCGARGLAGPFWGFHLSCQIQQNGCFGSIWLRGRKKEKK